MKKIEIIFTKGKIVLSGDRASSPHRPAFVPGLRFRFHKSKLTFLINCQLLLLQIAGNFFAIFIIKEGKYYLLFKNIWQ
jgi:hypothetical protein